MAVPHFVDLTDAHDVGVEQFLSNSVRKVVELDEKVSFS